MGHKEFLFSDYASAAAAYSQCKLKIIEKGNPTNCNNRIHLHGTSGGYSIVFDHGFGAADRDVISACNDICLKNGKALA